MKKLIFLLLVLSILAVTACGNISTTESTEPSDSTEDMSVVPPSLKYIDIVTDGSTDYKLVFSREGGTLSRDVAMTFRTLFFEATGANITPTVDSASAELLHEIVLGKTNRESNIDHERLIGDAYAISIEGEKIYIAATSRSGYDAALQYFFADVIGYKEIEDMSEKSSASIPETLSVYMPPSVTIPDGQTLSGYGYTVSGAARVLENYCEIAGTLTYVFNTPIGHDFNSYSITYCSTEAVRADIKYMVGCEAYTETVYLEAGDHLSFTALIDTYLKGGKAREVYEISVKPIKASSATFRLEDVTIDTRDVPVEDTVYISNGVYKLGIMLTWGGGISYLEDLNDKDDSLTNLLNRHDTGRLVQQSYYGTQSSPYECASYNGQKWGYNPVQGGDQYNNRSRLIDYKISEDGMSVYVKCQPLDWAKDNSFTPSYMENTYTICNNYIKVDNRFIDLSGYTHRNAHQELPAFYTVSYLSEFIFYDGNKAWTGGDLRVEEELAFWAGNSNAYFKLKSEETWCAWVSSEGYGVGLYTPIAEQLLAGRYQYNGSKSATNSATNYVAPLITYTLKTFEPFEYSYYITTGSADVIRDTFENIATAE